MATSRTVRLFYGCFLVIEAHKYGTPSMLAVTVHPNKRARSVIWSSRPVLDLDRSMLVQRTTRALTNRTRAKRRITDPEIHLQRLGRVKSDCKGAPSL